MLIGSAEDEFDKSDAAYPRGLVRAGFGGDVDPEMFSKLGDWCTQRYRDEFRNATFPTEP